jgi:hypothetical protein
MSLHMIEFRGSAGRRRSEVRKRVTMDSRNAMFLSPGVVEMLGDPEAVTLQFDPHKQIIGLTPAKPSRANAFPLKRSERFRVRTIQARPFCKHFGIEVLRTISFNTIEIDPETGTLLLDLTDITYTGREPGSRKGRR